MEGNTKMTTIKINNNQFYITNILSHTDILMTGGDESLVMVGDRFNVIDNEKTNITNPISGDIIAEITRFKYRMQVTETFKGYSRLTTDMPRSNSSLLELSLSSNIDKEKLEIDRTSHVENILSPYSRHPISIGDQLVRDSKL